MRKQRTGLLAAAVGLAMVVVGLTGGSAGAVPLPGSGVDRVLPVARATAGGPVISMPGSAAADRAWPCIGNGTNGPRVELLYAHVKGTPDRYRSQVGAIRTLAAQTNGVYLASASETGGIRQVRFRTTANCNLWVGRITLPKGGLFGGPSVQQVLLFQWLQTHGYTTKHHVYVVLQDGHVGPCGQSQVPKGNPVSAQAQYSDIGDRNCWEQRVLAHEIGHTLGAVPKTAPNNSDGAHCNDGWDLMCYNQDATPHPFLRCPWQHYLMLDCQHNDYFSTHPRRGSYLARHWNVARSALLTRGTPANDSFRRPITASVWCQTCSHADSGWFSYTLDQGHSAIGANLAATAQRGEPSTAGAKPSHSVWFRVVAPAGGILTVDTEGSSFNTVLGVYQGQGLASLTALGENDDVATGDSSSRVVVNGVTKGTSYLVKVDGAGGATGEVVLHAWVSKTPGPVITSISPTSGASGDTLTITGTNLQCAAAPNVMAVMVDGVYVDGSVNNGDTTSSWTVNAHQRPYGWLPGVTGPVVWSTPCGMAISHQNFTLTP